MFSSSSGLYFFLGYDGVPDVNDHLLQLLSEALNNRDIEIAKRQALQLSPSRTASFPTISTLAASPRNSDTVSTVAETMEKSALDNRGRTPPDSGIGSCTESDTSDCERKLAALRIREQQQQQAQATGVVLTRPLSATSFTPSWKRIKK